MHQYLRAIGFSKIKSRKQLESIYQETLSSPNRKTATTIGVDTTLIQIDKDFGHNIGLSLVGEIDASGSLSIEHYFPYVRPNSYTSFDEIKVERHCQKESYAGILDDINMSVIFYVQNIADYAKLEWFNKRRTITTTMLSALSTEGTVLIPLNKTYDDLRMEKQELKNNMRLARKARKGDADAIEQLVLQDIDLKNDIGRRTYEEDILSIVDTSLIPYGVECEHYEAIGTILNIKEVENTATQEVMYNMDIKCNEYLINVCINKMDLQGEPAIGRRFKGVIWLQGFLILS